MDQNKFRKSIVFFAIAAVVLLSVIPAEAQRRDHLTDEEIELVRDVQEIDLRMEIFVTAIERRIWVINGVEKLTEEQKKRIEKDAGKWGALPTGNRAELLSDISKILTEAVDKFEDVYEREPKSEFLPYAFYTLSDFTDSLLPWLAGLAEDTVDKRELGLLSSAETSCRNIREARENIPRPTVKKKKLKRTT